MMLQRTPKACLQALAQTEDPMIVAIREFWLAVDARKKAWAQYKRKKANWPADIGNSAFVTYSDGYCAPRKFYTNNQIDEYFDMVIKNAGSINGPRFIERQEALRTDLKDKLSVAISAKKLLQETTGYRASFEAAAAASDREYDCRWTAFKTPPTTIEGALAGLQLIDDYQRMELARGCEGVPTLYVAAIQNIAATLSRLQKRPILTRHEMAAA